jgi:hypothetical protein
MEHVQSYPQRDDGEGLTPAIPVDLYRFGGKTTVVRKYLNTDSKFPLIFIYSEPEGCTKL